MLNNDLIQRAVANALADDVGSGDITAALIPDTTMANAFIRTNENCVLAGRPWVDAVYAQLDGEVTINWKHADGEALQAGTIIAELTGLARSLFTGERCALNWLQTLSGTATTVASYCQHLQNTNTQLLDTRKTIPGLRYAQKYAVRCGGGTNHRMGLYDAYLIKENHIASCGSITQAVTKARVLQPSLKIEVEVENIAELEEAIAAKVDIIMLDNFSLPEIQAAVTITQKQAKLEVSGNVSLEQLETLAATGVDYISVGALTKHIRAIDLSMRVCKS